MNLLLNDKEKDLIEQCIVNRLVVLEDVLDLVNNSPTYKAAAILQDKFLFVDDSRDLVGAVVHWTEVLKDDIEDLRKVVNKLNE